MFTRDIAPVLFERCAVCHRPGQSAPFSLLSYAEARKHAKEIVRVTERRIMPPWPPEPGYGDPNTACSDQIGLIKQWFEEGLRRSSQLPPLELDHGWQLASRISSSRCLGPTPSRPKQDLSQLRHPLISGKFVRPSNFAQAIENRPRLFVVDPTRQSESG
jgi:hypothetical protein